MRIEKEYKKDFNAKSRDRNIFIFMDGTWNDENGKQGSGLVTNVCKLHNSLEEDSATQISRYFRGIGNDDNYGFFGKYIGGGTGKDEKRIRDEAYATIAREYQIKSIFSASAGERQAPECLPIRLTKREYRKGLKLYGKQRQIEQQEISKTDSCGTFQKVKRKKSTSNFSVYGTLLELSAYR
jgi:hypothetical protein